MTTHGATVARGAAHDVQVTDRRIVATIVDLILLIIVSRYSSCYSWRQWSRWDHRLYNARTCFPLLRSLSGAQRANSRQEIVGYKGDPGGHR